MLEVIIMNQVVVAPDLLNEFHRLATESQRSDAEVINEALASYLAADRHYVATLAQRNEAADSGDFASEEEVGGLFSQDVG